MPKDHQTYLAGIATTDITPPVGAPLGGFANRYIHTSTAVYHPLRAVALAIEDEGRSLLIVSAEWLGFYEQADRLRGMISEQTDVPVDNVILSATHTHCGPVIGRFDREHHGWFDEDYLQSAMDRMANCARVAWRHRYPATLGYGETSCGIAINRRMPASSPSGPIVKMAPNPDGPTDHTVAVVVVKSAVDDVVRGVIFSYACHPTSGGGLQIGGDYVGFAYDYLDRALPVAQSCFLQGCAGDQKPKPAHGERYFASRSLEEIREAGNELGTAVHRLLETGELAPIGGRLTVRQSMTELETEELDEATLRAELQNPTLDYRSRWARYHLRRMELGLRQQREIAFEIQTVSFGTSLAVVAMAGEMTVEHGIRLKRELGERFDHVLPLGYTNAMVGYVPVRRQFDELGYEVLDANQYFYRTGRYVAETEARVHGTVRAALMSDDEQA